ncbi:MAG TPA: adenylate/guanylate cyclase domain-containing protein [Anaerolineales bacterium]|nr:adenylate/guanylate cyclase domain-containing protein [Anaerolineales bacterium]
MSRAKRRRSTRVRFSLRWKITLPFIILALALGLGATFVVNRLLSESEQERFFRQLVDSGQQAADSVVRVEIDLLEMERLLANAEGVPEDIAAADAEDLRTRILPFVFNAGTDIVAVLDRQGTSLLAIRRLPDAPPGEYETPLRAESFYIEWPFVQKVLAGEEDPGIGDKYTGLASIQIAGQQPYVLFVAGPVREANGELIGAILVGEYLGDLVDRLGEESGANISLYDASSGLLLASTLETTDPLSLALSPEQAGAARSPQVSQEALRTVQVAGVDYGEVLTSFVARRETVELGLLGASLLQSPVQSTLSENVYAVARFGAVSLLMVVLVGLMISNWITRPLVGIADASAQVVSGNLDTLVPERGGDEITVLARSFNTLVRGLRESTVYRDVLGTTMTPEVRKQLRQALSSQELRIRGQSVVACVLCADLHPFSSPEDEADPQDVLSALNECFAAVMPIVAQHGGVLSKFDGDSLMAFFGVLPKREPPQMSSLQATHAAMEILAWARSLNARRAAQGLPALDIGVGIASGPLIAGGLGQKDYLRFTVIGPTVNIARRVQEVSWELGRGGLLITQETYDYLAGAQRQFEFGRYGRTQLRSPDREITVYEVRSRKARLVEQTLTERPEWNEERDATG